MPKKPQRSKEEVNAEKESEAARRQEFNVDPELRNQLVEIFGEEDVLKIESVYRTANKMETAKISKINLLELKFTNCYVRHLKMN